MKTVDQEIKKHIIDTLYRSKEVDISNIAVKVNGGVVELTGIVSSQKERQAVEAGVKGLREIGAIKNHIAVINRPSESPLTHVA